jgi:pimeloyl-ACP methyl ester carboxylesterase
VAVSEARPELQNRTGLRPVRWPREAWVPLVGGLVWLWNAPSHGLLGFAFTVLPGCLLLASGVAMLLWSGDLRISQFAALGGVLGVVFGLPAFVFQGFAMGLTLCALSAAGFVAAGWHTLRLEPHPDQVPPPEPSLALAAEIACDEAILSTLQIGVAIPAGDDLARIRREIEEARARFASAGWLDKPGDYHETPPPLSDVRLAHARTRGIEYEHLRFESGYEPRAGEPGRERFLAYHANRTAHAWVVRSAPERPWLVCIHGYQMGSPLIDLSAFRPEWLARQHGLNLLMPVLPLHGPRTKGRRSGDGYLAGDILDTIHAQAQAMWDIRRMLSWLRAEGASEIGLYGLSLGGYNASLLAALERDLACVVAGIPAVDFTRLYFRHGPPVQLLEAALHGIEEHHMDEILRVVSPLSLPPRVPRDRRYIFAAISDRLVPADQVRDLWRHWERPRIEWYQGAHVTFPRHRAVRELIDEALHTAFA